MEWIRTTERLPNPCTYCLVFDGTSSIEPNMSVVLFDGKKQDQFWGDRGYETFTHWMPLPEQPEK